MKWFVNRVVELFVDPESPHLVSLFAIFHKTDVKEKTFDGLQRCWKKEI